jgi:LPXTG-site transpeptidase (sortase) family protein
MLPESEKNPEENRNFQVDLAQQIIQWNKFPGKLEKAGIILIIMSVLLIAFIFFPVIREELRYTFSAKSNSAEVEIKEKANRAENDQKEKVIVPADEDFGIVIPKIEANAKVIADVDSQDSAIYQRELTKGVAQGKDTAFPGEGGNIFIFAHSSADFYQANRYNAVFYLLSKMEKGDDIYLFYKKQKYHYQVTENKTVGAEEVNYLDKNSGDQLTLMTCWPPGTTMKRLIVIASPVQ